MVNMNQSKVLLSDLEHHLWEAAHIITGPIDASDYKTYIFSILFLSGCGMKTEKYKNNQGCYFACSCFKEPDADKLF